mmetsp:Transcript_46757/g.116525  ORF Transcript_46757/g.116525 Transcript_46757/m.116525 type:complete len:598 (-) Transcript_46757:436-2229(-)
MHTTITFLADRDIDPTDKQLEAWRPRLAKTRRAVVRCHMNMSMVKLLDGVSKSLESLEADSHSVKQHEIASPDDKGRKPVEFPRLKTVVVGGRWAWASFLRGWTLRSLKTVELRKLTTQEKTAHDNEFGGYNTEYGWDWLDCDAVDTVTLSPLFAWAAHDAMKLVELTSVDTVTSFSITADEPDLYPWTNEDDGTPMGSLKAIEATIKLKQITPRIISSLNAVHKYCVSPGGKEDYSSSAFIFPFTLLWPTNPDIIIRNIYDSETPAFESSTLALAASLATSVTFPTSLAQDNVIIPAFYRLLPKLLFSSARTLTLQPARDTDNPLPQPLLFNLGRVFPSVRSIDMGKAQQLGEGAVVKTIDDLPSLRVVRFARQAILCGPEGFFLPSYLRNCASDGPLLHIKGAFYSSFAVDDGWSLWEGEEEESGAEAPVGKADGGDKNAGSGTREEMSVGTAERRSKEGGSGGIARRIRRISVVFSADYEPEDAEEDGLNPKPLNPRVDREAFGYLFDTCIKAISTLPNLECITLRAHSEFPMGLLHTGGKGAVGRRLSRCGFVAVQTGPCSVELCREGLPVTEGQRLITDYFSRVHSSNEMVD